MDLQQIKSLIDAMAASDLAEMEFSEGGWSLRLVRRAAGAQPVETVAPAAASRAKRARSPAAASRSLESAAEVVAPMFGMVYLRPGPDAPEFVTPGQQVRAGTTLCVIEAMKLFHEIRADRDGVIAAVLVASGAEVEAGQPLMRFA
jgi:acetyl-CoA carboxylase biotin carboxyl carrier protein